MSSCTVKGLVHALKIDIAVVIPVLLPNSDAFLEAPKNFWVHV